MKMHRKRTNYKFKYLKKRNTGFTVIRENLEIREFTKWVLFFLKKIRELSGNLNSNQGNHRNLEPCQIWIFLL